MTFVVVVESAMSMLLQHGHIRVLQIVSIIVVVVVTIIIVIIVVIFFLFLLLS